MKRKLLSVSFLLLIGGMSFGQSYLSDKLVDTKQKDELGNFNYISFKEGSNIALEESEQLLKDVLKLDSRTLLKKEKSQKSDFNTQHDTYKQYVNGVEVAFITYIVHSKDGIITSVNGNVNNIKLNVKPDNLKSTKEILKLATADTSNQFEITDQFITNLNASQFEQGKLVVLPETITKKADQYAYKFFLISKNSKRLEEVYLSALDGSLLFSHSITYSHDYQKQLIEKEKTAPIEIKKKEENVAGSGKALSFGTAETLFSGNQTIETSQAQNNSYYLYDATRKISTRNFKNYDREEFLQYFNAGTSLPDLINTADNYFTSNNYWSKQLLSPTNDVMALDTHWGTEITYNYFKNKLGRNGFNNTGGEVIALVHAIQGGTKLNSSWISLPYNNTTVGIMFVGDGGLLGQSNVSPMASLDFMAHEFGHGVVTGLIYRAESGAINEGIADVWAGEVENYYTGNTNQTQKKWYQFGEELIQNGFRDFSNPKLFGNADTYKGTNWINETQTCNSTNDDCGVHVNSGVINKWYYLLVAGGSGTNDNGFNYSVTGLGHDKTALVVYEAISYLNPNTTFAQMKQYTLEAAKTLFGQNSTEKQNVLAAWCAVGVTDGESCVPLSVSDVQKNKISIYPNPVKNALSISNDLKDADKTSYKITNLVGQIILKDTSITNNKIDVSTLAKGVYILSLENENFSKTFKFIKE